MTKAFAFLLLSFFAVTSAQAQFVESNDAGEAVTFAESFDEDSLLYQPHSFFNFKKNFETVTSYLTEEVEREFDLFIFANVSYEKYGPVDSYIPSQRMRIFRKNHRDQQVFIRNSQGEITGVYDSVLGSGPGKPALDGFPDILKISSGAGHKRPDPQPYVDTFSGMFRLNKDKSRSRRFQKGMYDSLYVDIRYSSGRASGIAIHGTPRSNNRLLGTQQSHGCVRINRKYSKPLYELAMSRGMHETELMHFNRRHRLPETQYDSSGRIVTRPGQKVLMVFFYGYGDQRGLSLVPTEL